MSRTITLGLLLLAGCAPAPQAPTPLRVAAASDLQSALPALAEQFTARRHIAVSLSFGPSGQLAEKIKAGAPFDVFLAANQTFVQTLAASGHVKPESVRPYARGTLVLAVHPSSPSITALADLARPEVQRIALANPDFAPYGTAGKQALERAGLWAAVKSKVAQAESVRQALQFVETGNAEAGLVGKAITESARVRVIAIDPALYDPIIQGLGVVARSQRPDEAERFARFVTSDEGQAVLARFGFARPDPVSGKGPS